MYVTLPPHSAVASDRECSAPEWRNEHAKFRFLIFSILGE